jgi:hypothetical protein
MRSISRRLLGEDILGAKKRKSFRRPPVTPFDKGAEKEKRRKRLSCLLRCVRRRRSPLHLREIYLFLLLPRRARDGGGDREARQHKKKKAETSKSNSNSFFLEHQKVSLAYLPYIKVKVP